MNSLSHAWLNLRKTNEVDSIPLTLDIYEKSNFSEIFQIESIYNYINWNTATHLSKYSNTTICAPILLAY